MASFVQTHRSQLNKSPFKQLYSFPKANRFSNSTMLTKAPYYDNKVSSLGKRSTTFGYGNKMSLQKKDPYPPPNQYRKDGFFQADQEKKRGYSFNHDKKKGIINEGELIKIPGPGKYDYKADRQDFKRCSYSFRGKYPNPSERLINPLGPGQYSTISNLDGQGKYFVSRFHDSGASKIGKSKRFGEYDTISPGPGKYKQEKVFETNNLGTYYCSNFRTSKVNSFSHASRKHIAQPSLTPGPGSYNRFSDFPVKSRR